MPTFFAGRLLVVVLSLIVFGFGVAALRSGEIRSRGYTFHRDRNAFGYWSTVLIHLVGPVAISWLILTR